MNARQKAKHFKRLYEQGLPKKPYPVVYQTIKPKPYIVQTMTNIWDDVPMDIITDRLIKNMKETIKENIVVQEDKDYGKNVYSLYIWMER